MPDSLWPCGLQHARLPCPLLSPEFAQVHVHWVNDAIYLIFCLPLLFLPSIFSNIRVFSKVSSFHQVPKYWASASVSVLPMNIQGWFPLGLTDLLSLLSKGHSRVISSTIIWKHQFFSTQPSLWSNSHIYTWHLMT